ncbi:ABC transporter substrate-binding protein [Streptomyces albipurpureus]|uniref:ABC transporter substrate-binding protein n=1 Tax=Streptomyces albipurpureus TaxID=2897419 RepID=A0ABT0URL3_9ACTN|nr:ABC transporter substrate-binding protein [Streptomyces sp. CWNU-1]MCM2390977.1 ABC transporter substrate-binding protein [Streptomyces sp. CWNU-1]
MRTLQPLGTETGIEHSWDVTVAPATAPAPSDRPVDEHNADDPGHAPGVQQHTTDTPGSHRGQSVEGRTSVAGPAPPGLGDALLGRVAGFFDSGLRSAQFLWCEEGRWAWCRLELRSASQAVVALDVRPLTGPPSGLTAREIDIISLVALGLSNREISSRLGTSIRTVTTQVERLLKKLGQDSRSGLSALAVDRDLIRLPIPGGVEHRSGIRVLDIERHSATTTKVATPAPRRVRPAPRDTVRIGTIAVGGAFAADGLETAQGAQLAVRDINALRGEYGRAVEHVVVHIDPLDEDSVREGIAHLAEADVDAITSSYASAISPGVFAFAADFGRTFLHTNTWTRSVDAVRDDPHRYGHVFQTCPSETAYQSALLAFLRSHPASGKSTPRLAVVELDGFGCAITDETFGSRVRDVGWTITSAQRVGLRVDRVDELIQGALADRPDVVVVSHLNVETAAELQNAITRHSPDQLTYHIYTPSVPGFARRIEHAGEVIWSTVTGRPDDPLGRRFTDAYARAFGTPPGRSQASAAYDQVRMLHSAFSVTGSFRPDAVDGYLRESAYRGVNGTYLFASPGQAVSGYPYDTGDQSLSQPTLTYRLSGRGQEILPVG